MHVLHAMHLLALGRVVQSVRKVVCGCLCVSSRRNLQLNHWLRCEHSARHHVSRLQLSRLSTVRKSPEQWLGWSTSRHQYFLAVTVFTMEKTKVPTTIIKLPTTFPQTSPRCQERRWGQWIKHRKFGWRVQSSSCTSQRCWKTETSFAANPWQRTNSCHNSFVVSRSRFSGPGYFSVSAEIVRANVCLEPKHEHTSVMKCDSKMRQQNTTT